ncbi:hypothetical protein IP81_01620 [Novosphingobium sp. AAP83]|nr:hypothetical protein IP81_01620 [Novosphingobium sp. AAP83]
MHKYVTGKYRCQHLNNTARAPTLFAKPGNKGAKTLDLELPLRKRLLLRLRGCDKPFIKSQARRGWPLGACMSVIRQIIA